MSCLRIKLFPAKTAWKTLTSKLHKLRRYNPISKTKHKPQINRSLATSVNPFLGSSRCRSHHQGKGFLERDSRVFLRRQKRCGLFKKKRKTVVYVDKLFRESVFVTNWVPAKQWKPEAEDLPRQKGIDERAEEFIARMKAEMIAARDL